MYNPLFSTLTWTTLLLLLLGNANVASADWGNWQFQIQRYFVFEFWVITPDYVTEFVLILEERPSNGRGTHYAQGLRQGPGGHSGHKNLPSSAASSSLTAATSSLANTANPSTASATSQHSSVSLPPSQLSSSSISSSKSTSLFSSTTATTSSTTPSSSKSSSSKPPSSSVISSSTTNSQTSTTSTTSSTPSSTSGVYGSEALNTTNKGLTFITTMQVGTQSFQAIVDTGSSDTWVINNGFQCTSLSSGADVSASTCNFGPVYKQDTSFKQIPNENFHQAYTSGETLTGILGTENVTVAGISVPNQEIGLVNTAAYNGDGVSSGLLGLGFPANTRAYSGTNAAQDTVATQEVYNPIFTNMYTNGHVPPVFSIALDRSGGGQLAFGGLPPVKYTNDFASSPFQILQTTNPDGTVSVASAYTFYTISVTGFAIPGASTAVNDTAPQLIIDSGTTQNYLPKAVADAINAQFTPAPNYEDSTGDYIVQCTSVAPSFGVVIGGKTFTVDPRDMVINEGGRCISSVAATGDGGTSILGHAFLKNVVAVFDVGSQVMRFAPHIY